MSIHYLRLFLINPHYYSLHILLIDPKKKYSVHKSKTNKQQKKKNKSKGHLAIIYKAHILFQFDSRYCM